MEIKFIGAAQTVTGSKHLITTSKGFKLLLDCGLFQGRGKDNDTLNRHFSFEPSSINALILSHAHIDHSGNIPNLVKQGFAGKIYCTRATYSLCRIMLIDSAHIHENDIIYINKKRKKAGLEQLKPLYTTKDVEDCLIQFEPVDYRTWKKINDEIEFMFTNAGHILGSAITTIKLINEHKETTLCYTGDIGRTNDLILKAPEKFPQANYIICESTYGNRVHETKEDSESKLLEIITETCFVKKGKLIIPAFSLGRTQEIVYTLDRLKTNKKLPGNLKVFVDSPLAIDATDIMRSYPELFNDEINKYMQSDPDPFGFSNLNYVRDAEESKKINDLKEPCVIISASGMMEAGRIKHHLKNNIEKPECTVLIVGFCPRESLGWHLIKGDEKVRIFGVEYSVKANVEVLNSYSAHADYKEMLATLRCQDADKVKQLFLVHGEYEAQLKFKETLHLNGFKVISIPAPGDSVTLK